MGRQNSMKSTMPFNYLWNLAALLRRQRILRPLVVTYYVTTRCNLNCIYCEDFGARRNAQAEAPLPLDQALQVLRVVREATDRVILTGGEPLLHPQIDELAARAKSDLGLKLTMLTNAALLHEHRAVLPHLARLVVSLDTLHAQQWSQVIQVSESATRQIVDNIKTAAGLQSSLGFRMTINCVITPQTLDSASELMDFARQVGVSVSYSPQAVQNWPHYELLVQEKYKEFLRWLLREKEHGAPIATSSLYLRRLLDFQTYPCYPTLAPRVMPNGDLVYPCRPVQREETAHGGRSSNLLQVGSWREAVRLAEGEYGQPPLYCSTCFQQCYAEPSLMQANPLAWLEEQARYRASRVVELPTFAPG